MEEAKERHGCISVWLWFTIISNFGYAIYYAVSMFDAYSKAHCIILGLLSILATINLLGAIMLMMWNKCGFYILVISSILTTIINVGLLDTEPLYVILGLCAIIIWWGILQIRKNGKSAWCQMIDGLDYLHRRHLYQLFATIVAALFVLTSIAYVCTDGGYTSKDVIPLDDYKFYADPTADEVDDIEWKTFYGDSNSCSIEAPSDLRYAKLSEDQTLGLFCTDYDPFVVVVYETINSLKGVGVNTPEEYANVVVKLNRNVEGSSGYKKISEGAYGENSFLVVYNLTVDGTVIRINTLTTKTKSYFYYCQVYCVEKYADKSESTIMHMIDSFKALK